MFETALAASRPRFSRRNRKLLPVALAVHGVLLAGVVLASYWSLAEVPEPDGMVGVVFDAGGPPPPLGAATREPQRTPAAPPVRSAPPAAVVQPPTASMPDVPPILDQPASDGGDDAAVSLLGDGSGAGVPWGVPGGTGDVDGGAGGEVPADGDRPIVIRAGVTPPRLLHRVLPQYTEAARRMRIEGAVVLEAIIGRDGTVADVRVLKGLGFGLDEAAAGAVAQWRYAPASVGGRVTAVYLTVKVDFSLR